MENYCKGRITTITATLAFLVNIHIRDGFIYEAPYLFWGIQCIGVWIVVFMLSNTFNKWQDVGALKKKNFINSIVVMCIMYGIGWIKRGLGIPIIFVLILGVIDVCNIEKLMKHK